MQTYAALSSDIFGLNSIVNSTSCGSFYSLLPTTYYDYFLLLAFFSLHFATIDQKTTSRSFFDDLMNDAQNEEVATNASTTTLLP